MKNGIRLFILSTIITVLANAASLTTTYASNNNESGNMFDVVAKTNIVITGFDMNLFETAGTSVTIEVYGKPGTWVGSETTVGDWTLLATAMTTSAGTGNPTSIQNVINQSILSGDTYSFYVTTNNPTSYLRYTNGTAIGNVFIENTEVQILEGAGKGYPFGATFQPRIWNGTLYYNLGVSTTAAVAVPLSPFGKAFLLFAMAMIATFMVRRRIA